MGSLVERLRTEMGISQAELARRADVPRETINRLEQNKVKLPSLEIRRRLSAVLGVSQLDFLVAAGELDQAVVDQLRGGGDPDAGDPLRAEVVRRVRLLGPEELREIRRYLDFMTGADREKEPGEHALG